MNRRKRDYDDDEELIVFQNDLRNEIRFWKSRCRKAEDQVEGLQTESRLLRSVLVRERDANEWRRLVESFMRRIAEHEKSCPRLALAGEMLDEMRKVREATKLRDFERHGPASIVGYVTADGIIVDPKLTEKKVSNLRSLSLWQRLKKQLRLSKL